MKEMKNVPKLRFPQFTGDWEQRKLEDVVEFLDTMRKPLEGAKRVAGPYPYYGASGIVDYVDGYIFDEELILLSEDGANITDRNYPVCFLASGKYWVNNHAHVLKTKGGNENNFICNSLERKDYKQYNTGMAMPKLNQEVCRKITISCPCYAEQKEVGDFFRMLDKTITLHQRKLDQIKEYKKGMLQKMFPKDGESVPEVRFPEFTGDWEQRKCKDVAPLQRGFDLPVSQMEDGDYPVVMSNGIGGYHSEYKAEGPGIVTGRSGTLGKLHYIEENYWPHNTALWVTDFKGNHPKFIYYMYQKLDLSRFGSGSGVPTLNRNDVHDAYVAIPQVEEQINIADLLTRLDETVTLHQRKLDAMKEYKKGLLQQMFV